jgi:hypothetical protein
MLALGLAACGGSATTTRSTSSAGATASSPPSGPTPVVSAGPVRGRLVGANHSPKIKHNWPYAVSVTDAAGHPLAGTVTIEFTFGGQVVGRDTPPTHQLKNGGWRDNLRFPPAALGEPIDLQAVVHTHLGSVTLDWPVMATR